MSRINKEEKVYWQYRTILFEYQKDGILGDKYLDDEEMEKVLNQQGEQECTHGSLPLERRQVAIPEV